MLETAQSSLRTVGIVGLLFHPKTALGRIMRYGAASFSGAVIDLAAFALLIAGGLGTGSAAVVGYTLGTAWHFQMICHTLQRAVFAGSGIFGLVVTFCIITLGMESGFNAIESKLAALCVTFASVWLARLLSIIAEDRLAL